MNLIDRALLGLMLGLVISTLHYAYQVDEKTNILITKPEPALTCPDLSLSASEQYKIAWLFSNETEDRELALEKARTYIAPICNDLGFYRND